jgi:sortase (surface protein transpeptidase)
MKLPLRAATLCLAIATFALLAVPSVDATQARRIWHAPLGGGASGTATLVAYTTGTGTMTIAAQGLPPSRTFSVMVYRGTCARPIAVVKLGGIASDASGDLAGSLPLTAAQQATVWRATWTGNIGARIASGSDAHCGVLTYAVATRVAVPALGIDLPVVLQKGNGFPYCNVAMYLPQYSQPGEGGAAFIYAHARTGMFLPLLKASLVNNGAKMIGMKVYAWTSDDHVYTYQVIKVLRHVYSVPAALAATTSQEVWLQTSEGPYGTYNKLFVMARRVAGTTATYAASHPTPHPLVCSLY